MSEFLWSELSSLDTKSSVCSVFGAHVINRPTLNSSGDMKKLARTPKITSARAFGLERAVQVTPVLHTRTTDMCVCAWVRAQSQRRDSGPQFGRTMTSFAWQIMRCMPEGLFCTLSMLGTSLHRSGHARICIISHQLSATFPASQRRLAKSKTLCLLENMILGVAFFILLCQKPKMLVLTEADKGI